MEKTPETVSRMTNSRMEEDRPAPQSSRRADQDDVSSPPLVSIGLPVYNGAAFLSEALESILAQTFDDFELIICDNASTDRTADICLEFASRDSRVRYHRQPKNMGACRNYDMSFHMARGRYFKWAAHDDLLAPTYLEQLVAVLEEDEGCVLVHPGTVLIDADGQELREYEDDIACDSDNAAVRLEHWLRPTKILCNPVFGLIRRDAMARTPLHGDYIASDRAFLAAMTMQGRCRAIHDRLFLRRVHSGTSIAANRDKGSRTEWFRGHRPRLPVLPYWRLGRGYLGAVRTAPLSFRERFSCYVVLVKWMKDHRRHLLRELRRPFSATGMP